MGSAAALMIGAPVICFVSTHPKHPFGPAFGVGCSCVFHRRARIFRIAQPESLKSKQRAPAKTEAMMNAINARLRQFRKALGMRNRKSIAAGIGTFTALLLVSIAYSQTPVTIDPVENNLAYCESAAVTFYEGAGDVEYAKVKERCRPGDTIGIKAAARHSPIQVARLCDFTKQIVNMGMEIICVLGPVRDVRK